METLSRQRMKEVNHYQKKDDVNKKFVG